MFSATSVFAESNGIWHLAKDVRGGIFGDDEGLGDYIFNSSVSFLKGLSSSGYCNATGGNCYTIDQLALNTNAETECSGTYSYLNGDGVCRNVISDGDINDTDTNANTQCSGTYNYLNGDGACRDVRSDGDLFDTDTNANTQCSGTYSYLNGDGACRDVRSDGDYFDTNTDTHGSLSCVVRSHNFGSHSTFTCSSGETLVRWIETSTAVIEAYCCRVV